MTTTTTDLAPGAYRIDWSSDDDSLVPLFARDALSTSVIFELGAGRRVQCYVENGELIVGAHNAVRLLVSPHNSDELAVDVDGFFERPGPDDRCETCGGAPDEVIAWRNGYRNRIHHRCP